MMAPVIVKGRGKMEVVVRESSRIFAVSELLQELVAD